MFELLCMTWVFSQFVEQLIGLEQGFIFVHISIYLHVVRFSFLH